MKKLTLWWYKNILKRNLYVESLLIAKENIKNEETKFIYFALPNNIVREEIRKHIRKQIYPSSTLWVWLTEKNIYLFVEDMKTYRLQYIDKLIAHYESIE